MSWVEIQGHQRSEFYCITCIESTIWLDPLLRWVFLVHHGKCHEEPPFIPASLVSSPLALFVAEGYTEADGVGLERWA